MEVFRLIREKFAASLSGSGAAAKGARWNSIGIELFYTAANRSLAMAEVAVHFTWATLPPDYVMTTLDIPSDIRILTIHESNLPSDCAVFPHPASTRSVGDNFVLKNDYCVLKVPSAVTKGEFNYLLNPRHKDFREIKIVGQEKFPFDPHLF